MDRGGQAASSSLGGLEAPGSLGLRRGLRGAVLMPPESQGSLCQRHFEAYISGPTRCVSLGKSLDLSQPSCSCCDILIWWLRGLQKRGYQVPSAQWVLSGASCGGESWGQRSS